MMYRFASYAVDTAQCELRREGVLCPVEPQVFDLLLYLIRNRDRVVTRDEVLNFVWRGRIVSDSVLATRLNAARRAIGDNGIEQKLIHTLRGRGIRFVGRVHEEHGLTATATATDPTASHCAVVPATHPVIAVIPFGFDGDYPHRERIADELTESLATALTRIHWLDVIAQNLSYSYKSLPVNVCQVGRELGASFVLTGKVHSRKDHVWFDAQLVDTATGHQIWAHSYRIGNYIAIPMTHAEIASQVIGAIQSRLFACESMAAWRKRSKDLSAWQRLVRAICLINGRQQSNLDLARRHVTDSIRANPGYAQGYSLLSYILTVEIAAGWRRRKDAGSLALEASCRALLLDPDDPWSHLSQGFALAWNHRPEDAILSYERAIACDPCLAFAHTLYAAAMCYLGRGREAARKLTEASHLPAGDLLARGNYGVHSNTTAIASLVSGEYRQGIEHGYQALTESPKLPTTHRILVANHALNGDIDLARNTLKALKHMIPGTSLKSIKEWLPFKRADERQKILEGCALAGLK